MREYKFRGKSIESREWVYGDLLQVKYSNRTIKCSIMGQSPSASNCPVDTSTVGQFTGLRDKNGTEIYEGDIVSATWYTFDEPNHDGIGEVIYAEGYCQFMILDEENSNLYPLHVDDYYTWQIYVDGNIHDNPEMLKGEKE